MTNKKFTYTVCFYAYIIQGMITISLGLLMPHMMAEYSMDYTQGGSMFLYMLAGGTIASTFAGALVNRLGEKILMVLGAISIIAGYSVMMFFNSIIIVYVSLFFVGTGTGIFNTALNSVVANASGGDHKKVNMLHTFFAVGALLMTLFAAAITYFNLPWRIYLYVITAMTIVCMFLFVRVNIEHHEQKEMKKKNDFQFFKKPFIYVFLALMFFYVGTENAVNGWVVTFLNDKGIVSNSASNYVLTILWILVIVGRYINRHIKKSVSIESRILVCSFSIIISYLFLINTESVAVLIISVIVLGLSMSAYYPNIITNISEKIKDNATALGLALSFGGLGGAVIPWASGVVSDGYGLKAGMAAGTVAIGFLIAASIVNYILKTKNKTE